jgi:hypothetical protein
MAATPLNPEHPSVHLRLKCLELAKGEPGDSVDNARRFYSFILGEDDRNPHRTIGLGEQIKELDQAFNLQMAQEARALDETQLQLKSRPKSQARLRFGGAIWQLLRGRHA